MMLEIGSTIMEKRHVNNVNRLNRLFPDPVFAYCHDL